jgi:hypothetical protein
MSEQNPDVRIPQDAAAAVELVADETDEDLSEQQKNLIIAQAELIDDI